MQRKTKVVFIGIAALCVLAVVSVASMAIQTVDPVSHPNDRANHHPLHPQD